MMPRTGNAGVRLRSVTLQDSQAWYEIRNDQMVRNWSRSTKVIRINEHAKWWRESLQNDKRRLFMVEIAGQPGKAGQVGIARLDHRGAWTEISLAVIPAAHGRGIGTEIVCQLIEKAAQLRWPEIGAVVNGKNARSLRIFAKLGFVMKRKCWIELRYQVKRKAV